MTQNSYIAFIKVQARTMLSISLIKDFAVYQKELV